MLTEIEKNIVSLFEEIQREDRLSKYERQELTPDQYEQKKTELNNLLCSYRGTAEWMLVWDKVKDVIASIKAKLPQPKDLDEVVQMIIGEIEAQNAGDSVKKDGIPHHGAGTSIRNRLYLWWYENHDAYPNWPKEKPLLVQWFNDRNIFHADDMSGTITEAVQAKLRGEEFDFDKHVKRYLDHWKKYGFKDGIYTPGKEPTERVKK